MHTKKNSQDQWAALRAAIESKGAGTTARIPKRAIPHPRAARARPTTTFPVGQVADYALDAASGPPLVVREFAEQYEAALDSARFAADVVDAITAQPASAMYLGAALLGGAVGSSLSQKREGVVIGAGIGLLVAAILEANLNDGRRRT